MIITHIICPYCEENYSGVEALEHLDKEIEIVTFEVKRLPNFLERQEYFNVLTLLLANKQIIENNIEKQKKMKCNEGHKNYRFGNFIRE